MGRRYRSHACGVVNANTRSAATDPGKSGGAKRPPPARFAEGVESTHGRLPWAIYRTECRLPESSTMGRRYQGQRVRRGQRQRAQGGDGSGKKRRRDKTAPGNVRGVGRVAPWSNAVGDIPDRMPATGAVDHGSTLPKPRVRRGQHPTCAAQRRNNGATGAPGRPAFPRTSAPGHPDGRPASPASAGAGSPGLRPQAPRRAPTPAGRRPWRCRAGLRRRVR